MEGNEGTHGAAEGGAGDTAHDDVTAGLEDELRVVEDDLAEVRRTIADLHERIGDRADEPTDPAERGAMIESLEEQEALGERLGQRRDDLLRRLGRE